MVRGKGGPPRGAVGPGDHLARFAKRKDGLKKKAEELATRCAVDVAVVCTGPGGAGDPDFWPSKEAASEVLRRYGALSPSQRAAHMEDHAALAARRLSEEREKLVRAGDGAVASALGSWDSSLEGVSEEKLRELFASIQGSLVAAKNRALKLQALAPVGGAADRLTFLPALVHKDEVTEEDSLSATDNEVPPRPPPWGEADAGGGGLGQPPTKNPKSPNAVPVEADKEVVAENIVTTEDAGGEVQILQPPGDATVAAADDDDAEWLQGLINDLRKKPQPYKPAAYAAGVERIRLGRFVMERDAYNFIRFDIGMPPPSIAPNSLDDDGEPLKLWSWENTMPSR